MSYHLINIPDDDLEGTCKVCSQLWDGVKKMGQCSRCAAWYHLGCINKSELWFEKSPSYYCKTCLNTGRHFTYKALAVDELSFSTLAEGRQVDDVIIQFYSMWSMDKLPKEDQKRFYIFPVFFYTKLTDVELRSDRTGKKFNGEDGHKRVMRWTKDVDIFTKDMTFIFINVARSHWILLAVCFPLLDKPEISMKEGRKYYSKRPCLLVLDPLNKGEHVRKRIIDNIYIYLSHEFKAKYSECDRLKVFGNHNLPTIAPIVPEQSASSADCGVFVMKYLSHLLQNPITIWERPMVCDDWFTRDEGSRMREEVRHILEKFETTAVRPTRSRRMQSLRKKCEEEKQLKVQQEEEQKLNDEEEERQRLQEKEERQSNEGGAKSEEKKGRKIKYEEGEEERQSNEGGAKSEKKERKIKYEEGEEERQSNEGGAKSEKKERKIKYEEGEEERQSNEGGAKSEEKKERKIKYEEGEEERQSNEGGAKSEEKKERKIKYEEGEEERQSNEGGAKSEKKEERKRKYEEGEEERQSNEGGAKSEKKEERKRKYEEGAEERQSNEGGAKSEEKKERKRKYEEGEEERQSNEGGAKSEEKKERKIKYEEGEEERQSNEGGAKAEEKEERKRKYEEGEEERQSNEGGAKSEEKKERKRKYEEGEEERQSNEGGAKSEEKKERKRKYEEGEEERQSNEGGAKSEEKKERKIKYEEGEEERQSNEGGAKSEKKEERKRKYEEGEEERQSNEGGAKSEEKKERKIKYEEGEEERQSNEGGAKSEEKKERKRKYEEGEEERQSNEGGAKSEEKKERKRKYEEGEEERQSNEGGAKSEEKKERKRKYEEGKVEKKKIKEEENGNTEPNKKKVKSESKTELKQKKKDTASEWSKITTREQLEATDTFTVVSSRLSPAPSNSTKYQRLCTVTGNEVLRRVEGPEAMSATVLGQMLRLGKSSPEAKALNDLIGRLQIKRRTNSANLSSFSVLTEDEIRTMAKEYSELAATKLDGTKIKEAIWNIASGSTDEQKTATIQTAVELLETINKSLEAHGESFNSTTHGGLQFMLNSIEWIKKTMADH